MSDQPKFLIKTFGCQMNVADTERMGALLNEAGLVETQEANEADLILVNGCSVREKAVHKAVSFLGTTQFFETTTSQVDSYGRTSSWSGKKGPLIGLGGCVGQLDRGAIFQNAPYVDFVFGPDAIDQLPEIVHRVRNGDRHLVFAEFDPTMSYSTETKLATQKASAFVNIMKGCDKYCTYCIVPYTRGREKSRTIDEVLEDLAKLVSQGVREVTLLGQNVNSFGKGNPNAELREPRELHNPIGKVGPREGEENFPQLLRAIDSDPRLARLRRVRFTSSHPLDFSDELIDCYHPETGVKKLAAHLHLPVQSGSNRVLQKMGRHHKIETYVEQMDRLRALRPEIGLSTDLIVGFPTETEAEFEETVALLDRVRFDNIYAFAYSPRPGTRASKLPDDVSAEDKNRRLNALLDHELKIAERAYAEREGKVMEVLVESLAKSDLLIRQRGLSQETHRVWTGRTSCNRVVNFVSEGPRPLAGAFLNVKITGSSGLSLVAELIHEADFAEKREARPQTCEVGAS